MGETLAGFAELVDLVEQRVAGNARLVVAIAGPPAAGKSTIAESLRERLGGRAAILGLDAFHYDDAILKARGHRARKGAPHTFDVDGYRRCLRSLIDSPGTDVAIPRFDRDLELSRNCAEVVAGSCDVIITEGNYLLLDDDPWPTLAPLFDLTVFLAVPMATVSERILQRWLGYGLSGADAEAKADTNDLPNAELVLARSSRADLLLGERSAGRAGD